MTSVTAYERDVVLDSIALIAASRRRDTEAVGLMHAAYSDPEDRAHLYACILANSLVLMDVIQELGTDPDKALGALRMRALEQS